MSSRRERGGRGILGSHIAEALVGAEHTVRCSVRASSDTRWIDHLSLETPMLELGAQPSDQGAADLRAVLEQTDVVVHCGGVTRARNEAQFHAVNADGTARLATAAAAAGVARFVLISSLAARGPDGAGGPISPYGRSKAAGEAALERAKADMESVVLRPGGIYGPRDPDLLPLFKLVARGLTVVPRSEIPLQPVFVTDAAAATLAALDAPEPSGPLPIAAAEKHGWTALADALSSAVGRNARLVRVPPAIFWTAGLFSEFGALFTGAAPAMDRRRAKDMSVHAWTCDPAVSTSALPGWAPHIDIRDGLERTAEWYREVGWL